MREADRGKGAGDRQMITGSQTWVMLTCGHGRHVSHTVLKEGNVGIAINWFPGRRSRTFLLNGFILI